MVKLDFSPNSSIDHKAVASTWLTAFSDQEGFTSVYSVIFYTHNSESVAF